MVLLFKLLEDLSTIFFVLDLGLLSNGVFYDLL